MTNLYWLVAAYSVFFILLFAYTARLALKQKDIERRIADLRRNVDAHKNRERQD